MRATAILPLVCATAAFVLSMLVLFAGDTPKVLPTVYMLRLNTSGLGEIKPFGRKQKRAIGDLVDSATDAAQDGAKAGVDAAQDLGNAAASAAGGAIADAINLKDFYSAHLMTFCQGDFKPDAKDPDASEDVSECSERQASFVFDPEAIFSSILPNGVSLSDLGWPDELTTAMESVKTATRAMYFFYIVGISMAGIAMIGAVFGILAYERTVAMANLGVNVLSFFGLGLASAIASGIIFKAADEINELGQPIGLQADRGSAFLGMTWTAAILMLMATIGWVGESIMGRRTAFLKTSQVPTYNTYNGYV